MWPIWTGWRKGEESPTVPNKLSVFWGNTEFQINPITAHNCRLSLGETESRCATHCKSSC